MHQIVVGVDGSDESWKAIEAARDAADGSEATVTAVYAEFLPSRAAWGLGESLDDVVLEDEGVGAFEKSLTGVLESLDHKAGELTR